MDNRNDKTTGKYPPYNRRSAGRSVRRYIIIGYGNIGKFLYRQFTKLKSEFAIKDINIPQYSKLQDKEYEIAFVCVPTETDKDTGNLTITSVEDAIANINAKTIVIKSTLPVGTCQKLIHKYKKNIVFSPEFYGTTQFSPDNEDFIILGGDKEQTKKVAELYYRVKGADFSIRFTDLRTAELTKLMINAYLGLKVQFCYEFADIGKKFGVVYPELRECVIMDKRFGNSHSFVYPNQAGYDSHCLNKDIPAIVVQAGIETAPLTAALNKVNLSRKKNKLNSTQ